MSESRNHLFTLLATFVFFSYLLFLSASVSNAQILREYTQVDTLRVGDTFTYSLTLNKDAVYDEIVFPDSSTFGDLFEIRSRQRFRINDFKDSLNYTIQYFGTQDTVIPSLPVFLVIDADTSVVYTNPVPIYFSSVLESDEEEFRPLKPIFDFAAAIWPWLLALLLIALIGWYFYKLFSERVEPAEKVNKPEFKPIPFENPLKTLEDTINGLKTHSFESREDFKEFYIKLGDAIRTYFEDLYRIPALESTSREIIYELKRRAVDNRLIEQTKAVLREADMVKFANFKPTEEQAESALSTGEEFVDVARRIDAERIEHVKRVHEERMAEKKRKFESNQEPELQTEEKEEA